MTAATARSGRTGRGPSPCASVLTRWISLVHPALAAQLVIQRRVERDGHAVVRGDRPARLLQPLHDDLGRLEHVKPITSNRPPSSSRNSPASSAFFTSGMLRAETRREDAEVGLDPEPAGLDPLQRDLLDPQFVGDLRQVCLDPACALDHQGAQRLAVLELGLFAGPCGRGRRPCATAATLLTSSSSICPAAASRPGTPTRRRQGRRRRPAPATGARRGTA